MTGRHQELLDAARRQVATLLDDPEVQARMVELIAADEACP